jgi:hypothetical protein
MQDRRPDDWPARIAAALGVGSRWLSAASLVVTACAVAAALDDAREASLVVASLLVLGTVQVYLALRIELDRAVFDAAAHGRGWEGFDAALREIGLGRGGDAQRGAAARASGLLRLVRCSGALFVVQVLLVLGAVVVP